MPSFPVDMALCRLIRRRGKLLLVSCIILMVVNLSGVLIHPFERDLTDNFSYPLDLPDFQQMVALKLRGQNVNMQPINSYDYRFINLNAEKCHRATSGATHENASELIMERPFPRLVLVIKSSLSNRRHRDTIRKTWGFQERFSDVEIRRVFILGSCDSDSSKELVREWGSNGQKSCQDLIDEENQIHSDIVQADFIDSYYNNTIKTMMGLKWVTEVCPDADFAFFVDDDYYVSTKNLLKFARNPFDDRSSEVLDFDGRLYAGYVFPTSSPMRHKISKWYVSLEEYPYASYPPYVTAGAYLLSRRAFKELHLASNYVKHFRFDDIYMGILSKKIGLTPTHCSEFYFYKKPYDPTSYASVIASHGFGDHQELTRVWNQQKGLGNC